MKRYEVISLDEAKKRRRVFKVAHRIERLEVLLAKRKAELRQLGEEPMRLWWVSFVEASAQGVDIVVRAKDRDDAFVTAARLLDDPIGEPSVYELLDDLYHGRVCAELNPDETAAAARLASGCADAVSK